MAAKIRVHELAKELGLTNKETLDLCVALGIAVKTHSSSIEDAQADRVRRKAERELGDKFDIREFHDQVLDSGALPLPILEEKIESWIANSR